MTRPPPPLQGPAWTDADTTRLTQLHAAGKSLNAIATEMNRAKATISKYAAKAGLDFDRTRTAKAAEAVHVDNKARRAVIVSELYDEFDDILNDVKAGRTGQGWRTILKGEYGVENETNLGFIPPVDRRTIHDTMNRLAMTAVKLESVDSGDQETSAVSSWLKAMLHR